MVGIYQITNKVNGKKYIGQSVDVTHRTNKHFNLLRKGLHYNKHLQSAVNKYGVDMFERSILLLCDKENLTIYEQLCVDGLNPEYNMCKECVDSRLGVPNSEETKKKMKESRKVLSEEHKRKIGDALRGKTVKNRVWESGTGHPLHGRPQTEEHKRKRSEALKGRPMPEHVRQALYNAHKGIKRSDEVRKKISDTLKMRWATMQGEGE